MCDIYRDIFVGLVGYDCGDCGGFPSRYTVNRISQCVEYEVIVMTLGYDCCKFMRSNEIELVIRVDYADFVMNNMEDTDETYYDNDYDDDDDDDDDDGDDNIEYTKLKEENRHFIKKLSRNCFLG